jgi:hypothetical protein
MAFQHMRPGQRANCIPGVRAITFKKEFVQSWQEVRGRPLAAGRGAAPAAVQQAGAPMDD